MQTFTKPQTLTPFLLLPQAIFKSANIFKIIHYLLSPSLFFLRLFLSFLPSLNPPQDTSLHPTLVKKETILHEGNSGIARALSQVLSIMNEIPVTSRKYETVRCLGERIIDENLHQGCEVLREVNRTAVGNAFGRTLGQLVAALLEQESERVSEISGSGSLDYGMARAWNVFRGLRNGVMGWVDTGLIEDVSSSSSSGRRPLDWSAEKFAAEVYWLAQKLVACGDGEEAVSQWGSASNLALLALSSDPRIQSSLVKVSAFLFRQARMMEDGTQGNETQREQQRQKKTDMLTSWLPFLCRASNGTDSPVLSNIERMELEKVLEELIEMLGQKDEQEKILALWLYHYTSCPSSDWPNLQTCYTRWCSASRKLLASQ